MSENADFIRTTCPRDCYDACGILVERRGGSITRVVGDPRHQVNAGALCGKCAVAYNGVWRDPTVRLASPLIRIGAKGAAQFREATWSEAIYVISRRLQSILDLPGGSSSILHSHYTGTCSLIAGWFPLRFFNYIGATEVDPDTVCNKAGHTALEYMFGDSGIGFDPRTATDADCIIIWGANPAHTAPHQFRRWLSSLSAFKIVIDPIRTATAQAADLFLQPYPGTDAALSFAILHVLRRENMLDQKFIAARTVGWSDVDSQLHNCTPEWAEAMTGVPAVDIETAAKQYGAGPSLLWLGQGLQRQPSGGNVIRSCSLLPVATGNFAKPGAGLLYMNGFASRGISLDYLTGKHLRRGPPASISHMDLATQLEDRKATHAFFTWNNNVAASSPQQVTLRRALSREDLFHVAIELFHTDTTAFADVVLPAASFLEFDDLILPYFDYSVSAQTKATDPLAAALPNQEIFRRLAGGLGLKDAALFEDDASIIACLMQQTGLGIDFRALSERGTIAHRPQPRLQFSEEHFATPSGRIEISTSRFAEAGLPRAPVPLPDPSPEGELLRVLSPASKWLMNSSYGNDPRIRKHEGAPIVMLNSKEAQKRGLVQDEQVVLRNDVGVLGPLRLLIDDSLPRQVAVVPKGRWPSLNAGSNINAINPGTKTDLAESSAVHGLEARLEKFDHSNVGAIGG